MGSGEVVLDVEGPCPDATKGGGPCSRGSVSLPRFLHLPFVLGTRRQDQDGTFHWDMPRADPRGESPERWKKLRRKGRILENRGKATRGVANLPGWKFMGTANMLDLLFQEKYSCARKFVSTEMARGSREEDGM